jgi:3-hydroxyisobutyrate dehydrogenase
MASTVIHVGPIGAGHAAKALNNLVSATSVSIAAEALHAAAAFGIDGHIMTAVLNASSGRSNTSENKVEQFMLSGSFDSGFALALMAKDVGIGASLARELGAGHELADAVAVQWSRLAAENPGADHTAVYAFTDPDRLSAERTPR